ncbi:unnamed protein product [Closterium sp. NIES-53]
MASLRVLAFDHEGRPVQFDTWLDDVQLYLLCDSKDSVSRFDLASGATTAPPATADSSTRSQTAHALYDAVVTRYSSPATAALGRLLLPYLFPELSAFATVKDLITHYFIVTCLPDSLHSVKDHFLSLDPTSLTVDLLEQHLLAAETSAVAVGAARGTPRSPFFEGCSPSPLAPSYASAAAADVPVPEDVGAASTSAKRRSSKGKGGQGGGGGSGGGGGGSGSGGGGSGGGGGGGGSGGGSGGSGGGGGGSGGSGGSGGGGTGGSGSGARRVGSWGGQRQQQQRRSETLSPQSVKSRIAIFDLDFDAILSAMYSLSISAEDDCYRCVPPDPGIAAAALGASEPGPLPGTAPAEALHTFTLDSDASRCFFHASTTLTPLPAPIPVVARSSTVLSCPAVSSGGSVRLTVRSSPPLVLYEFGEYRCPPGCDGHYHHSWGLAFCVNLHVHTDGPSPGHVHSSAKVESVAASCSCRLLSQQTLQWHHRLGHPSLPCLRGMHSHLLVSGLPRSLPPLPPSPAPPCLPCVEGRQRAAPHSSSFSPMTAPLQTLHMDVWGPARVSGQSRECYFLLVVDDYTRYTTIFPLRSKGQVVDVLIAWIRIVHLQLRERFGQNHPVLRLHSDRGGEFSSNHLREFCCGEGILQSFTLSDSPQQNGIAERRIGLVMEVARTSMIHAAAPHFLWPFAVQYAAHQLNLWPRVSLPKTSPTLRWTGEVGDASVFRFYHPTSRRVLSSQDVTFDESVPFYHLFPYRSTPPPPPPLFLAPDPLPGPAPVEVAVGSGAARGATSGGAASGGAEPGGAGVAAGASGAGGAGVATGARGARGAGGARTRGTGATGTGGVEGAGVVGPGAGGAGAVGVGVGGTRAGGTGAVDPCAGGAGGTVRPRTYFSQPPLQPASPLPAPSPYTEQSGGLTEHREHASRPVSPICTAHRAPRSRPPPVPGTHAMALCPSSVTLLVPLPAPPESSLPEVPDPESDRARVVSPAFSHLLATAVTDPSFESAAASALVAELLDFAAACRLDYATALVPESASASPPSERGECALGTDILEDRQEDFECLATSAPRFASMLLASEGDPDAPDIPTPRSYAKAITGSYSSQWQAALDAEMASWKSTGTYRDYEKLSLDFSTAFLQGSPHEEIWLRRPPGFTGTFPAGTQATRAALGFAPSTTDPSLILRTDTSVQPFYVLVYVEDLIFATDDTEALTLVKSELQKRHTCTDVGELRSYLGLQITRDRARRTITLTQSHMVHQVLQRFGFQFSSPQPTPLSTSHSLSAPPLDESVEPSGPYPELVGCIFYLMTTLGMALVLGGRGQVVLTGHANASWVDDAATQRSSQGYTFSLGAALAHLLADRLGRAASFASNSQRGQLRLAYVATRANCADVFTKALRPCDYQRFATLVKRPPGSPPAFKARYVARGFSQRQGVDYFQTFSPTPNMTTLRVLLHFATQRDYELHSLDFSTAFLQGSLHEEIWLRCPPGFTGSFPAGTQWSLRQPVYGLR